MTSTLQIHVENVSDDTVRISCWYAAPQTKVYEAWTQPASLAKWFAPSTGMRTELPSFDCRVGGKYVFHMIGQDGSIYTGSGEYLDLDPYSHIRFTWQWADSKIDKGESEVSIRLEPEENGTRLVLTHCRLSNPESVSGHAQGWTGCLNKLAGFLAE